MTEKIIQVGRFTIRKKANYLEPEERIRLHNLENPGSRIGRSIAVPEPVDVPEEDWTKCRSLKQDGERCNKGRAIFKFFCGIHDPTSQYKGIFKKTMPPIQYILERLGFRGEAIKRKTFGTWQFQFIHPDAESSWSGPEENEFKPETWTWRVKLDEGIYRVGEHWVDSLVKRVPDIDVATWIRKAMYAEDMAYMSPVFRPRGASSLFPSRHKNPQR